MFIKRFTTIAALMAAFSLSAAQLGQQHNKHLDCLRRADPSGGASATETLRMLVDRCGFRPGMPTRQFVAQYARLIPREIISGAPINLSAVARQHAQSFTREHFSVLNRIQNVIETKTLKEASRTLGRMHAHAKSQFRSRSQADTAVLAALDIGASSARYWDRERDGSGGHQRAKWWQVVLGDVAGGIVGGVFGGGVGAVGLGTACSKLVAGLD